MLKQVTLPLALLLLVLGAGCPSTPVRQDPNVEIGRVQQALVIVNASAGPIILLPAGSEAGAPAPVTLQPGESQRLPFTLSLQRNTVSGSREILLLPQGSSPLITQSAIDLVVRAKFPTGTERDVRIKTGECVFGQGASGTGHSIRLDQPPLPGVPVASLCP